MPNKRTVREGIHWLEYMYGGRRIYLCWYVRVGAMGQRAVRRTLLGRVDAK